MVRSGRFFATSVLTGLCLLLLIFEPCIAAEDSLSRPQYGVIFEQDVTIPLRDGTVLVS